MDKPFSAYQGDEPYIFVCYAHGDSDVVYPEIAWLHEKGINLWYDEGISAGDNWRGAIGDALIQARKMLFYISKRSLESDHCNREINLALDEGLDVIPIYLESVDLTSDLKVGLTRLQALHRANNSSYRPYLLQAVRLVEKPAPVLSVVASVAQGRISDEPGLLEAIALGLVERTVGLLVRSPLVIVRHLDPLIPTTESSDELLVRARARGIDALALLTVVQATGRIVDVTAKWLDVALSSVSWSETYSLPESGIDPEGRIPASVTAAQIAVLAHQADDAIEVPTTRNADAYRSYLLGRVRQKRHSHDELLQAIDCFEAALDLDPAFPLAWVALAETHDVLASEGVHSPYHHKACRQASRRALALHPQHPEALSCLARTAWQFDWEWEHARELFEQAIEGFETSADLHVDYSDFLCNTGQFETAIVHARRAVTLDPFSPWNNTMLAQALHFAGRHAEAVEQASFTLEIAPNFDFALLFRGLSKFCMDDLDAGLADIRLAVDTSGRGDLVGALALCLAVAQHTQAAETYLKDMLAAGEEIPPISSAITLVGLRRDSEAIEYLERCKKQRDWHLLLFVNDPLINNLTRESETLRAFFDDLCLPGW